jgi:hypothetical protein
MDALTKAQPSDEVFRRIENAATQRTRSQRQRLTTAAMLVLMLIVVVIGSLVARYEAAQAEDAKGQASRRRQEINCGSQPWPRYS